MKKSKSCYIFAVLFCALCSILFVGCGDETPPESQKNTYTITLAQSSEYTLSADKTNAEALEKVTITATLNTIDKKLLSIKYGDQTASKNSDGTFTFFMPAKNTTVSAELEQFEEILASDNTSKPFVSFSPSNTKVIVPNTGEIELFAPINGSYMTLWNKIVYSSNTASIPYSAIRIEKRITSSSNTIIGADIYIDTAKVQKGYSWLELNFINLNTTSQRGKIVFKITVDDVIAVETWDETLIFDISLIDSKYQNGDFRVSFSDWDYVNGMNCKSYQLFENLKAIDNKITVNMKYTVSHRYQISVGVADETNPSKTIWFNLMESIGEGSAQTGLNQFKKNKLTFVTPNSSLTIKAM